MKKILFICFVAVLCLVACDRDPKFVQIIDPPTTAEATNITRTSAEISAVYSTSDYYERNQIDGYGFYLSTTSTFDSPQRIDVSTTQDEYADGKKYMIFNATLTELEQNTEYFYYAFVSKRNDIIKGEVKSFTTNNTAVVTTQAATYITNNSVQVNGSIQKGAGTVNLQKRGFLLSYSSTPTTYSYTRKWEENTSSFGKFSASFANLSENYKYYFRAYAVVDDEIVYGNIMEFTTSMSGGGGSSSYITAEQLVSAYNSLGLAEGQTAGGTYTVRGYVSQWKDGYPDHQNADFWINDGSAEGTSTIRCYRLTGVNSGDKHKLNVGDFVELQNCRLMRSENEPRLYNGSFTILNATPVADDPRNDILGTYSMSALLDGWFFNYQSPQSVTWSGIRIVPYGNENEVKVIGLNQGNSNYVAYGTYNKSTKKLTLRKTTDEEVPEYRYYSSSYSRYYENTTAEFFVIEYEFCDGDCGVWSGMNIPYGSADSGDFKLISDGKLEQGKSVVESSATWLFRFYMYAPEMGTTSVGSSSAIHDVVLTRTSTTY